MKKEISAYVRKVSTLHKRSGVTEDSYRIPLVNFFESVLKEKGAEVTNDPKQKQGNKPDISFQRDGVAFGYVETKDIPINLDDAEASEQLQRYLRDFPNLILTNYLEFRLYHNGKEHLRIQIAKRVGGVVKSLPQNYEAFADFVEDFRSHGGSISSADELAKHMAHKARVLKKKIKQALAEDKKKSKGNINLGFVAILKIFKDYLIHDLSDDDFADMYAQTLVYGMLAACMYDDNKKDFTRERAAGLIPESNPFLRKFFRHIAGDLDKRIESMVDELAEVFNAADVISLMRQVEEADRQDKKRDPFLHFYETFLTAYDPKLRKDRGVYYTPDSVVDFIVRAVDDILKKEFKLQEGLADKSKFSYKKGEEKIHRVQILDPATGTGTFLAAIVEHIFNTPLMKKQRGTRRSYVREHLIPRLHGFEYLMASYAIAHAKLGKTLREAGGLGDADDNKRLQIFLTNSLEERNDAVPSLPFGEWLQQEAEEADKVKQDKPIMVVIGNPPYKGESENKGKWIEDLIEPYKNEPKSKTKLKERNPKWLNDDYVKFIRLGESYIERSEEGVLAYICNHGFLDNSTFRGMRWHLLRTFDKIYVLNLHGNANKKETAPDGSKDENVFDIQQGVSINLFIKTGKKKKGELAEIRHHDLWGTAEKKYRDLDAGTLKNIDWKKLDPRENSYLFIPWNNGLEGVYNKGFSVKGLFPVSSVGIITARDDFTMHITEKELTDTISQFMNLNTEEAREQFNLGKDARDWTVEGAKKDLRENIFKQEQEKSPCLIAHNPFDTRYTYYTGNSRGFICMPRSEVMRHFLADSKNCGLIFMRGGIEPLSAPVFITNKISGSRYWSRSGMQGVDYSAPLYLYPNDDLVHRANGSHKREPNLNEDLVKEIAEKIGLRFVPELNNDKKCFSPYDLLDYIYAVLHSPAYREKYVEFLRSDFPRVPYPKDAKTFRALANLGSKIRKLHLMEEVPKSKVGYPEAGKHKVEKINFDAKDGGKVFINSKQHFTKVPKKAWEFYIGGYQPAQKWLKDRKGRCLTADEIEHYQKIITVLIETDRLMQEIDKTWKP